MNRGRRPVKPVAPDPPTAESVSSEPPVKRIRTQTAPRRVRCGHCASCLSDDCGKCEHCLKKKKFGGDGNSRQACIRRGCVLIHGDPDAPGGQKYVKPKNLKPGSTAQKPQQGSRARVRNSKGAMRVREPESSSDTNTGKGSLFTKKKAPKRPFTFTTKIEQMLFPPVLPEQEEPASAAENAATLPEQDGNAENEPSKKKRKTLTKSFRKRFMGRKMTVPAIGLCAACGGDDQLETVLLCDGEDCEREYHLTCAGLKEIPAGDWFCVDCHPTGCGQDDLVEYFEQMDEARSDHPNSKAFCQTLWLRDFDAKDSKVPVSEVERAQTSSNHKSPKGWIGKPVWIRLPKLESYVPGRIVDHRPRKYDNGVEEDEYLVRFAAGHRDRKETLHRWLYLEEHQMMVGEKLVWAGSNSSSVAPALIYRRTSRELALTNMKKSNSKRESYSEARLMEDLAAGQPTSCKEQGPVKVGYFGRVEKDKFHVLEGRDSVLEDFDNKQFYAKYCDKFSAQIAAALVEQQEQKEVAQWSSIPMGNPLHSSAIRNRDYFTMPTLAAHSSEDLSPFEGELQSALCPLVMQGVDHCFVLEMLQKSHGTSPTREIAANLTCQVVPYKWRPPEKQTKTT